MIRLLVLHKSKVIRVQPDKAALQHIQKKKIPCWIDLDRPTPEEIRTVSETFSLHPLVAEDMTTKGTRIKVEDYSSYLLFVGYGLFHEKEFTIHEFDFVLGKTFLISSHHIVAHDYDKLVDNPDLVGIRLSKGPDNLFHKLLDILVDNYRPVLEKLEDSVEALEEEATQNADSTIVSKILRTKRKIVQIKKVALGMREQTGQLAKDEHPFISSSVRAYLRDVYDHAIRVSDQVDSYREIISGAYEAYMSTLSNRMNEVMKVLAIISTIMLPLSFLTGLYGMNFHVMPGLDNPIGFWIMVTGMLLLAILMLSFFRSRKWL